MTGSDRAESSYLERLRVAGIEPQLGHDPAHVPPDAEVVVSTAVPEDNPELVRARERGQRVIHRGELLAELCAERRLLAIAGTHGKTTTTAMCVWALRGIGADPAFFLGGELPGAGPGGAPANAGWGEGEWVVAEADESDASFLELRPEMAVITNLELDHHSRWGSLAELSEAFAAVRGARGRPRLGRRRALAGPRGAACRPFRPGARGGGGPTPDAEPDRHRGPDRAGRGHPVSRPGRRDRRRGTSSRSRGVTTWPTPWRRSAGCRWPASTPSACAEALAGFPGVARRLERKGERNGARIYDDYAHHPTEVSATLEAARELGSRRLIAAFQPHLYSRTKALASELGAALAEADEMAVLDVYPAREEPVGPLEGSAG